VVKSNKNLHGVIKFMMKEEKLLKDLCSILDSKYNWTILLATLVVWLLMTSFVYSANNNYDLSRDLCSSFALFSGASLLLSYSKDGNIARYSLVSFILAIFTLPIMKTFALGFVGTSILLPFNIFAFFLLLKNIHLSIK